jgi:hypothetical protein
MPALGSRLGAQLGDHAFPAPNDPLPENHRAKT